MTRRRRSRPLSDLIGLAAMAALIAAVVKELRLPADQRTWHGRVARFIPYDLRRPTLERIRERVWAPEDPQLIQPRAFGVGWTVNVGRIVFLVRDGYARHRG